MAYNNNLLVVLAAAIFFSSCFHGIEAVRECSPEDTDPNADNTYVDCCEGLVMQVEPRPTTDPNYIHWTERFMCRAPSTTSTSGTSSTTSVTRTHTSTTATKTTTTTTVADISSTTTTTTKKTTVVKTITTTTIVMPPTESTATAKCTGGLSDFSKEQVDLTSTIVNAENGHLLGNHSSQSLHECSTLCINSIKECAAFHHETERNYCLLFPTSATWIPLVTQMFITVYVRNPACTTATTPNTTAIKGGETTQNPDIPSSAITTSSSTGDPRLFDQVKDSSSQGIDGPWIIAVGVISGILLLTIIAVIVLARTKPRDVTQPSLTLNPNWIGNRMRGSHRKWGSSSRRPAIGTPAEYSSSHMYEMPSSPTSTSSYLSWKSDVYLPQAGAAPVLKEPHATYLPGNNDSKGTDKNIVINASSTDKMIPTLSSGHKYENDKLPLLNESPQYVRNPLFNANSNSSTLTDDCEFPYGDEMVVHATYTPMESDDTDDSIQEPIFIQANSSSGLMDMAHPSNKVTLLASMPAESDTNMQAEAGTSSCKPNGKQPYDMLKSEQASPAPTSRGQWWENPYDLMSASKK